jgi:hypothetical protein
MYSPAPNAKLKFWRSRKDAEPRSGWIVNCDFASAERHLAIWTPDSDRGRTANYEVSHSPDNFHCLAAYPNARGMLIVVAAGL